MIQTNNKYQKAIIYMITTGTDKYVGSTCNYTRRKCKHKSRIEFKDTEKNCNSKLYRKIRDNGEWFMAPIKKYPCDSKFELELEEERFRIEYKANLNSYQCHGQDPEAHRRAQKKYREKNKEKIKAKKAEKVTCKYCGSVVTRTCLARHKQTKKCLEAQAANDTNVNKLRSEEVVV